MLREKWDFSKDSTQIYFYKSGLASTKNFKERNKTQDEMFLEGCAQYF